jgi:hypothetical protein
MSAARAGPSLGRNEKLGARLTSADITLTTAMVAAVLLTGSNHAVAVPSFARQTGLACEACHTVFPELLFRADEVIR